MGTLARRVGLGLAARGDVKDTVAWAERARAAGLESVWFHDSYFERDAVTYATAVAAQVEEIKIGLGALNPFTRHPVLIAMTVSALDEMAPGRIRLGLGSALPLRLGQMGIPYAPDDAASRTVSTIETLQKLWKGERLPPGKVGLPPLQPMFAPVLDPRAPKAAARDEQGRASGGSRSERSRRRGLPARARRRHAARRAQPREARAVRHLHDEHPLRRHPRARGLRARATRPDRGGVAERGLHDRRWPHPRRSP
ncbi:MAG: LLM class flavin-dependent oxidoreductase [Chloroflexi bacterium]|nr:MAG: LLM class flavin-dependent oxidoreductase [Chloroflexota bacterium]